MTNLYGDIPALRQASSVKLPIYRSQTFRKNDWKDPKLRVPYINVLKPTGHVMHQQFNIQQLYVLPTLYLCVLYLSENKQRLVPLRA